MGVLYAEVIGDPIAHSKSPLIHNFWLKKLGISAEYRATRVTRDELPAYLADRRADPSWRGCNVTMPLKMDVGPHVLFRSDPSFPPAPINLVLRRGDGSLEGHAFDTAGFTAALLRWPGARIGGPSGGALVLGAGGAARAVIAGLSIFGFAPIWIANRTAAAAEALAADFAAVGACALSGANAAPPVAILVNATPLGMLGYPEPDLQLEEFGTKTLVFDLVTAPVETGLLASARALGMPTMDGITMLIEQARPSFRGLFGSLPSGEWDGELRQLLA